MRPASSTTHPDVRHDHSAHPDELTPEWFSHALDTPVRAVEVLDAHSGTAGRHATGGNAVTDRDAVGLLDERTATG
ncbi:hypothetical protein [Mycobacterium sp. URHB0021]